MSLKKSSCHRRKVREYPAFELNTFMFSDFIYDLNVAFDLDSIKPS